MTNELDTMAREFIHALGIYAPSSPSVDLSDETIAHVAAIIVEEAIEFAEALGCRVSTTQHPSSNVTSGNLKVERDVGRDADIVAAAHELGDVQYASATAAVRFGFPMLDLLRELHISNMTKVADDGTIIRHPVRNNDARYRRPNIAAVLEDSGLYLQPDGHGEPAVASPVVRTSGYPSRH